jgi:hypothetical protein
MNTKDIQNLISDENKKEALDFILENILGSGFGVLGKTDIDSILFATILKYSGKSYSDYELSRLLGLTPRRISNLREKVSIRYIPISREEAINIFIKNLKNAKQEGNYIDIPIYNVAVKNEIESMLYEQSILLYTQLNPRIFRIRIDDLFELLLLFQSLRDENLSYDELKNQVINNLSEEEERLEKIGFEIENTNRNMQTIKQKLLSSGVQIGLEVIKTLVPGGELIVNAINILKDTFGHNL